MEQNYSIDEILSAIDEIQNKKKVEEKKTLSSPELIRDDSGVPKHTLKLIEEAEKTR